MATKPKPTLKTVPLATSKYRGSGSGFRVVGSAVFVMGSVVIEKTAGHLIKMGGVAEVGGPVFGRVDCGARCEVVLWISFACTCG